ncbi:hypothetical protein [Streptomyces sp. NPDC000351]|uniref:hypothetical protein n=1 Tax=Streptomyces sp. NPDC000351 TaxID=3154250 RepID=UPI003330979F
MSGGRQRYWNETTQRWEDTEGGTAPVTPPPPPRPGAAPETPRVSHHENADHPPGASLPGPPPAPGTWSAPELPHTGSRPRQHPQAPPPTGTGGRPSRRLLWSVLGGAAAAGVAGALVLTLVVPGDDGTDDRGDHAAVSASASPTPEPSAPEPSTLRTDEAGTPASGMPRSPSGTAPDGSGAAGGPELPDGYELHSDAEGFTIARPVGWVREEVPSKYGIDVVNYRSSDGALRLQVYQVEEASPDASFELFLSDDTARADGFRQISLETLDDGDFTGSRLEYLADSIKGEPGIGTWHVVDERFLAADGEVYAIAAYGAEADGREDERTMLRTALDHFCPPYTTCGTDADTL